MSKFLVIQTAFIGDVVLGTAVAEKLHMHYPAAEVHFLVRKGNEGLLKGHPFINKVLVWDKTAQKQRNLLRMITQVRAEKYTHVINLHRFATSGIITTFSGAHRTVGYDKNPLSFLFSKKVKHVIADPYSERPIHEIERNQQLIADITDDKPAMPALYPSNDDYAKVAPLKEAPYICIAPSSVWFTKQFPVEKWIDLVNILNREYKVYLLGGRGDKPLADQIVAATTRKEHIQNLSGQLNFLQSAALMQGALMNYVNDSAPLHFASAVNAPVTAVFCSTVPAFGFGPVRENSRVVEHEERLYCRPCGLHGHKACPEGHFKCALDIRTEQLLWWTSKNDIKQCIDVLAKGGVILYPTDTIWGIGCDALNEAAVDKVFDVKQRPKEKSLIVLLAEARDILRYVASPPPDIIDMVEQFDRPTTIVFEHALEFPENMVHETGSIAIRVVNEPFCKALIKRYRRPIISTSANISGAPGAARFAEVSADIRNNVDYIVKYRQDDEEQYAPSRIVRISDEGAIDIIRP